MKREHVNSLFKVLIENEMLLLNNNNNNNKNNGNNNNIGFRHVESETFLYGGSASVLFIMNISPNISTISSQYESKIKSVNNYLLIRANHAFKV